MKYLLITILIVFSGALFLPSAEAQNCRSEKRGYCVELASLAQAQMLEELFPLNSVKEPGDIIPALYKFGLGLVAISALGALIVGGVFYMTAGGSQDRAKRGRTWLGNAVFGLVLALLSYLILNTINPDFLKRLNLNLTPINPAPPIQNSPAGQIFCQPLNRYTTENECIRTGFGVQCAGPGGDLKCTTERCPSGYNPTGNQCNLPASAIPPAPQLPPPGTNCNVVSATQRPCGVPAPCSCTSGTPYCNSQRLWACY